MRVLTIVLVASVGVSALAAQVPLRIANPAGLALVAEPITTGVPFPPGALASPDQVRLLDAAGAEVPLQAVVTSSHPDGSVRWLLLDFQADVPPEGAALTLEFGPGVTRAPIAAPVTVTPDDAAIAVSSGPLSFTARRGRFAGLSGVTLGGAQVAGGDGGPYFLDDTGVEYRASLADDAEVEVELEGPLRSVVTARGWFANAAGERKCRYIARIHAYAGKPFVRVFFTWIMTESDRELRFRDIGFRLPMAVDRARFGLTDGPVVRDAPAHLLQFDADRCQLGPAQAAEVRRATGWFGVEGAAGSAVIACRDFEQLFPKELEATPEGAIFHVWPAHGVAQEERPVTDEMLKHLWFVHEGPVLDFRVPDSYFAHQGERTEYEMRYVRSAEQANALGIAKTHELLIGFGAGAVDQDEATALNARLQEPPAAMAAPEWMCASGVFGALQPYSPERFGDYEAMLSGTFDAERRMEESERDFGMWNFGDGHTVWDFARGRFDDVYRVWRNTHHGAPRVPWVLYVRSGDPKYLRYGVRNARHVLDEDFVHWTNDEFAALPYPQGKTLGALNDYKGLVHWHSGTRLTDYNSMTDFALWYWHLTGDRWGLEVARQWGDAVIAANPAPFGHREGAGTCAALIELYRDTLDQRYFDYARRLAEHLISTQREDGSFPQWENYAPWLERWWELTRDPAAADALVRWADAYMAGYGDSMSSYGVAGQINTLAYAYFITGREQYIARGLWELDRLRASVYTGDDPLLQGLVQAGQVSLTGYGIQRAPVLLKAAADFGRPIEPDPLFATKAGFPLLFLRTRPVIDGTPTKIETVEAWILEGTDREFTITVATSHSYPEAQWTLLVTAPDGAEAARHVESYPSGEKTFTLTVPADGQTGVYRFTCARPGSFGRVASPVAVEPALPVAFPLAGRLFPTVEAGYHVWVPPGVTSVRLRAGVIGGATSVQLTAPDGTRAHATIGADDAEPVTEPMPVPADDEGGLWRLNRSGDVHTLEIIGEGAAIPQLLFQGEYPPEVCAAFAAELGR